LEGGSKQAPAVLLLHSAYGDAAFSWSRIWEELAAEYRVIAPDMPGFGASQAPKGMSLSTLAGALRELLDQLGVARAAVVGNSFGASAAIGLADLHPECVERLVLVNGTTLQSVPGFLERAVAIPPLDRAISAMFYRASFGHKAIQSAFPHASPEELSRIYARVDQEGPANFETVKGCVLNSEARKPSVTAPVRVLWGADDRFTPLGVARRLCKSLPGAELVTIKRAGHLPQWDQPREFVARLAPSGKLCPVRLT
jgi:pimeloyl-ACP methyl ester carboxylesterase